mmetsp:Transcript_6179/g.15115  ORF Transcript_6179/g.15115 Transcript_6179/m.15115 type:complete len:693 (-) Transcript_6179:23-2101(-)
MPSVDSKDHRSRRSRRDGDSQVSNVSPLRVSGSPFSMKTVGIGVLVVCLICSWQFILLTRHVDQPEPHGTIGQNAVNEAMWRYIGVHEANLSSMAYQQRDIAHVLGELGEELKRQHKELRLVEEQMHVQGNGRGADDFSAQLQLEDKRLAHLQRSINQIAQQTSASILPAQQRWERDLEKERPRPPPVPERPGERPPPQVDGISGNFPKEWLERFSHEELMASAEEAEKWREGAKKTVLHAWNGYKQKAWGEDELKPTSGQKGRTWAKCGLQILDALSTIYLMGLTEQFDEATKWVEESLQFDYVGMVSFFEITIRALGGLASAHSLSGREIFLTKAKELADKMMPAFDRETGFPATQVNLQTGQGAKGWYAGTVLSEAGTVQLEFRYISQQTGDPKYAEMADKSMRSIIRASGGRGLVPWGLSRQGAPRAINQHITFGAMGDSYYEYLLKMYLQTDSTEPEWKEAWERAMREMMQRLVLKTQGGLTYVAEEQSGQVKHKMDHLACFVGGMLVYGARQLPASQVDKAWEPAAAGITETCYQMYHRQPSHLAPECVTLVPNGAEGNDMTIWQNAAHYLLRPEAAEAIFYMFYYTGDPKYRRMAGEIYEAIEQHTRTTYGYSAVRDVRQANPQMRDEMETFFLAETMKYLYLTFLPNPREVLDLNEFVFTTEAHPLRVFRKGGQAVPSNLRGNR